MNETFKPFVFWDWYQNRSREYNYSCPPTPIKGYTNYFDYDQNKWVFVKKNETVLTQLKRKRENI